MKNYFALLIFGLSVISCKKEEIIEEEPPVVVCENEPEPEPENDYRDSLIISMEEFSIPSTDIRALEVLSEDEVWFAGSGGKWGYTSDGGLNWQINQYEYEGSNPEFRSISVNNNGDVYLVSIESPAAIFKSSNQGSSWTKVYEDESTGAFFDAVEFWDDNNGILLGDPLDGCFNIVLTTDGGDTWTKVDCEDIPVSPTNEYPFASSNTNIALIGDHAWFGTGGHADARVFHSSDKGLNWEVVNTPITSGADMKGIYSIDFFDAQNGIIAGGNWDNVSDNSANIAMTTDGGNSWQLVLDGDNDGYVSCVQYIPNTNGTEIFTLKGRVINGSSSMGFFNTTAYNWQSLENSNYLSVQFASKHVGWISGKNKISKIQID